MRIYDVQVGRPTIQRLNSQQDYLLLLLSADDHSHFPPHGIFMHWWRQGEISLHLISPAGYPDIPLERPA